MLLVADQKEYYSILSLHPQHTVLSHSIKLFGYKTEIKFDKDPWISENNNYATKIVNAYISYDFNNCSKIPLSNLTLKNVLFRATNIVRNIDKSKCVYSSYGTTFDGLRLWIFGNDFARNVLIFGFNNISSSHADKQWFFSERWRTNLKY